MTNHWADMKNSTLFVIIAANPAENHPASWAHINYARDTRGAKIICVDPRKTRSALQADTYVRIRPGTDIAFMNGIMRWIMDGPTTAEPTRPDNLGALGAPYKDNFKAFLNDGSTANANRTAIATDGLTVPLLNHPYGGEAGAMGWPRYHDARLVVADGSGGVAGVMGKDYAIADVTGWAGKTVKAFPMIASNVETTSDYTVYKALKAHVEPYDLATVAAICGCTQAQVVDVATQIVKNSRIAQTGAGWKTLSPVAAGYKVTTILYAMGATQHTYGSQIIRSYAVLQSMLGNMGRAGGGINALRGIHNVQGSTDFGVLFDLIPGYSGNPKTGDTFAGYMNALFGNRLADLGNIQNNTKDPNGAMNAYWRPNGGLQQRGFYNMTQHFFGDPRIDPHTVTKAQMDSWFALWPRENGFQHIESFQKMKAGVVKGCYILGQNPAVSEPNQKAVRDGLEALDVLVLQECFGTETVQCHRKGTGWTYLFPACSYIEEGGSVTNSGRWIQWRERCKTPVGNSKADIEWVLRFAKALDVAGGFNHIPLDGYANRYAKLWAYYGWTPGTVPFETLRESHTGTDGYPAGDLIGSEIVARNAYMEICSPYDGLIDGANRVTTDPLRNGGTMWIYSGNGAGGYCENFADTTAGGTWSNWSKYVRAMNRDSRPGAAWTYNRWGWAWLLNRRVFYNNGEVPEDVGDLFVRPGCIAALFCCKHVNAVVDWAGNLQYRSYSYLNDEPSVHDKHLHYHNFPCHTEPYETPYGDLMNTWGHNTKTDFDSATPPTQWNLVPATTPVAGRDVARANFPFILTTIRCVEHFQGGPITRNNSWNVEAEPVPWVEINSEDARNLGIVDGQYVNLITARSNSTTQEVARTAGGDLAPVAGWAKGFKARVGVGLQSNQRVGPGVVAIPWHWGERGLGVGSRANDLCIDAWDANTTIPEYKACLCRLSTDPNETP